MGCGIQTLPNLLQKLERSPKNWCLVVIHNPENPSRASRQLEELLDDLDEDSGESFDFFLPGYEESMRKHLFNYALIRHCDKWDEFTPSEWLVLLCARPEFADKCGIWSAFSTQERERLLLVRPGLVKYRSAPGGK